MSNGGAIIGGLHEHGLDYMETPFSGVPEMRRVFRSDLMGDMIEYRLIAEYWCLKKDAKTVSEAIPIAPVNLILNAGRLVDGSTAPRINWGSGYVLDDLKSVSESPSIVRLNVSYVKPVPQAQIAFPSGLTLTCLNGVYTFNWKGDDFNRFDTGTGVCGAGLEFVKLPAETQVYEVVTTKTHTEDGPRKFYVESRQLTHTAWLYYKVYYPAPSVTVTDSYKHLIIARTYLTLAMRFDGITFQTLRVPGKETVLAEEEFDGSATPSFTPIGDVDYGSVDYSAELRWTADGNKCSLVWCGEPFLTFIHTA